MKGGAIFDMDGLLFDTEVLYNSGWERVAKIHGLTVDQKMMDEIRGTSGATMYGIVNRYWPDADVARMVKEVFEDAWNVLASHVPVKPGVREILAYLKEHGVKLAVASSSPLDLILNNLKVSRIGSYFDAVVSGEQVNRGKPAPDIFFLAADKIGLKAEECYVFEDGPNGVYAGVEAGCSTLMIPDLIKPTKELYHICTGIYPNLKDALQAIQRGDC